MLGYKPNAEETDRVLYALSDSCRRRLLFELYEVVNSGDGACIQYTHSTPSRSESERIQLCHTHLPKLEQSGYIEWNGAEETIRKGPQWGEIEPFLDLISDHL